MRSKNNNYIHAVIIIRRSGFRIYHKKYKNIFLWNRSIWKKYKKNLPLPFFRPRSVISPFFSTKFLSSRDPVPLSPPFVKLPLQQECRRPTLKANGKTKSMTKWQLIQAWWFFSRYLHDLIRWGFCVYRSVPKSGYWGTNILKPAVWTDFDEQ
jgi:hypothetical protein